MDQKKETRQQLEDDELDTVAGGFGPFDQAYACDHECGRTSSSFGTPCPCGGLYKIQVIRR